MHFLRTLIGFGGCLMAGGVVAMTAERFGLPVQLGEKVLFSVAALLAIWVLP